MKKFLKYFVLVIAILALPFAIHAEGEKDTTSTNNDKPNVYIFRGEGCPHCEEAMEFFNGLSDDVKSQFNLVEYETWYNAENNSLMTQVMAFLKDKEASGVPYIIIGKKTYNGFTKDWEEEMLSDIKELVASDNPYDAIKEMEAVQDHNSTIVGIVTIVIILVFIGFIVYSRLSNKENDGSEKKEEPQKREASKTQEVKNAEIIDEKKNVQSKSSKKSQSKK